MSVFRLLAVVVISLAQLNVAFGQEEAAPPLNLPAKPESFVNGRGHSRLGCITCHNIHKGKGQFLFPLDANKEGVNPKTNAPYEGVSAVCIACHADAQSGGLDMVPVSLAHGHPVGDKVDPKVATVNEEFLRDGRLECVGCHDPHLSNQNWALLRVDTKEGTQMDVLCAMCHPSKSPIADVQAATTMQIFTSMDETKPLAGRPPAPAPKKPAPAPKE